MNKILIIVFIIKKYKKMKFKLKQPIKYIHEGLQNEESNQDNQSQSLKKSSNQQTLKLDYQTKYKKKKIINKKNQPSAIRLDKINQTFFNIYSYSNQLFEELHLDKDNLQALCQLNVRQKCTCGKKAKFYCLKCRKKVCHLPFPSVELPFKVVIIHHESEKISKSSAMPLQFLTNQVSFYAFSSSQGRNQRLWNELPKPGKGVYVLFPHKESKLVQDIFLDTGVNRQVQVTHLIILDCTWFQTDQILLNLQQKGYNQFLRIQGYKSLYWRYNHHNDKALSSAEALAFFMREFQKASLKDYSEQSQKQNKIEEKEREIQIKKYDNLLFLYCLNLKMILKDQQLRNQPNQYCRMPQ